MPSSVKLPTRAAIRASALLAASFTSLAAIELPVARNASAAFRSQSIASA
jgi:hypothetical protein